MRIAGTGAGTGAGAGAGAGATGVGEGVGAAGAGGPTATCALLSERLRPGAGFVAGEVLGAIGVCSVFSRTIPHVNQNSAF